MMKRTFFPDSSTPLRSDPTDGLTSSLGHCPRDRPLASRQPTGLNAETTNRVYASTPADCRPFGALARPHKWCSMLLHVTR